MNVTCLFTVDCVVHQRYGETVKLQAQYDKSNPEELSFAEATPSGQMEFFVTNKAVLGAFKPGQKVRITLVPEEEG